MSENEPEFKSFGKYEVLEEIGQGAMGVVYRAHDPVLDREVAIKTISASLGKDDELRRRFHREAQAAARLNHANIITIYEYGEAHGKIYIAMELLEGTDLKELMLQGALQAIDDRLAVMEQILDGLAFAHSKEVVHRDLKPGNIHIQPNGQIKILDFGLARLGTSDMTQSGVVMGTPNYMSPEQVLGDKIDVRSDIFSLGAVFYELLSGHKPFESESMHGVLFQVVHKDPTPLRQWVESLPPVLVQVVERCLAKEKEERFQDATELRDAVATVRQALAGGRADEVALDRASGRVYYEGEVVEDSTGRSPRSWPPTPRTQVAPAAAVSGSSGADASGPRRWVEGTVALDVKSQPPAPPSRPVTGVRRSADTLSGRSRTRPGPRPLPRQSSQAPIWLGIAALLAAAVGGARYLELPPFGTARPAGSGADTRLAAVTGALVRTQLDLARSHFAGKKYSAAQASLNEALTLDPRNASARELQQQVEQRQAEIESAASEASSKAASGEVEAASLALARLLELDPSHPVVAQLSTGLNQSFRSRAEEAQQAMQRSRGAAERSGGRSIDEFGSAAQLAEAAVARLRVGEFAEATRGFLESRDAFDRAGRAAREAAAPAASEPTPAVATATPAVRESPRVASGAPTRGAGVQPSPPAPPPVTPPVTQPPRPAAAARRALVARGTQNESGKKGPSGFEGAANPDFMGQLEFEAPAEVGPGDEFAIRVVLANVGRKRMRLRGVQIEARINREPSAVPSPLLADSVEVGQRALVAEVKGTWPPDVESWSLQVDVLGDQGDTTSNRLTLRD